MTCSPDGLSWALGSSAWTPSPDQLRITAAGGTSVSVCVSAPVYGMGKEQNLWQSCSLLLTECSLAPASMAIMHMCAVKQPSCWWAPSKGRVFSVGRRQSWQVLSNALPNHGRVPWFSSKVQHLNVVLGQVRSCSLWAQREAEA